MPTTFVNHETISARREEGIVPKQVHNRLSNARDRELGESILRHVRRYPAAASSARCKLQAVDDGRLIELFRKEPGYVSYLLRILAEAGLGFSSGATSLEQISRWLRNRSFALPWDVDSLTRCCNDAEVFFGLQFGCSAKLVLFRRTARKHRIFGMTELGVECWALAEDALIEAGVWDIDE